MELLNWILAAVTTIAGTTTFITLFMFRKQQARIKNAEASQKESEVDSLKLTALQATVEELRKQIIFCESRLASLQALIVDKDTYIGVLSMEKHTLEVKNARNKSAINEAYKCTFCEDIKFCPVILQRNKNEESYLKSIEKR